MSDIDSVQPVACALDQDIGKKNNKGRCLHENYYNSREAAKE